MSSTPLVCGERRDSGSCSIGGKVTRDASRSACDWGILGLGLIYWKLVAHMGLSIRVTVPGSFPFWRSRDSIHWTETDRDRCWVGQSSTKHDTTPLCVVARGSSLDCRCCLTKFVLFLRSGRRSTRPCPTPLISQNDRGSVKWFLFGGSVSTHVHIHPTSGCHKFVSRFVISDKPLWRLCNIMSTSSSCYSSISSSSMSTSSSSSSSPFASSSSPCHANSNSNASSSSSSSSAALLSIAMSLDIPFSQTAGLSPEEIADQLSAMVRQEQASYRCSGDYLLRNAQRQQEQEHQPKDPPPNKKVLDDDEASRTTDTTWESRASASTNSSTAHTRSEQQEPPEPTTTTTTTPDDSPLDASCREKMCDWSFRVCAHFQIPRHVTAIAFSLLDRYLDAQTTTIATTTRNHHKKGGVVDRRVLKLAAMTSLFVATKIHHFRPLSLQTLVELSKGEFVGPEILAMEQDILQTLQWKVHPPLVQDFVQYLLRYVPLLPEQRLAVIQKALYWSELAVYDYDLILHGKSIIALAAVCNALETVLMTVSSSHSLYHATTNNNNSSNARSSHIVQLELWLLSVVHSLSTSSPVPAAVASLGTAAALHRMVPAHPWGSGPRVPQHQQQHRLLSSSSCPRYHRLAKLVQRTQRRLWYLFTCSAQYELEQQELLVQQQAQQQAQPQPPHATMVGAAPWGPPPAGVLAAQQQFRPWTTNNPNESKPPNQQSQSQNRPRPTPGRRQPPSPTTVFLEASSTSTNTTTTKSSSSSSSSMCTNPNRTSFKTSTMRESSSSASFPRTTTTTTTSSRWNTKSRSTRRKTASLPSPPPEAIEVWMQQQHQEQPQGTTPMDVVQDDTLSGGPASSSSSISVQVCWTT